MMHTKLELEPDEASVDLDLIFHAFDRMILATSSMKKRLLPTFNWQGGMHALYHAWERRNNAIEIKNLFMTPGGSVDQQIFALPTLGRTNCKQTRDIGLQNHNPLSENVRHTPSSLWWTYRTEILKLYTFVVPKGQEPYLELLEHWTPTYEAPFRVYLDQPK
jgi:hypothetical protein